MGTPDKKISELVEVVRSWIPRRAEPPNVSRDFWMPDQSCRVCYECDSQFTIFNRRHHCRICGRVFCAKCTANFIPAPSDEPKTGHEDWERIRVCNYCFRQWERGEATVDNVTPSPTPCLSPTPSATSLASTKSSCTCHSSSSTAGSVPYATGPYQRIPYSPHQSSRMDLIADDQENVTSGKSMNPGSTVGNLASNQYGYCFNRSDDEDDDYGGYHSDTESRHFSHVNEYGDPVNIHGIDHVYEPLEMHHYRANTETQSLSSLMPAQNLDLEDVEGIQAPVKEADDNDHVDRCDTSHYIEESTNAEPVDFENNGLLWLPPDPEDKEDEREAVLFDDEDDDDGAAGEWGYLRSSTSFGSGEYHGRDKTSEEHRKAMKNVVEGHFRALVAQLLQVESLAICDEDQKESWLDIITALSWEAATLLKPDMSKGGGMDPGGYVKVKCIASGRRSESKVVKGVVCKKNVAHRRMTSKYDKPRFLMLGGALEYQRVSNQLSSVDTLLQQEMDHLKMAVAKIGSHYPNVLVVEKSVSRYAQEYLLAKDISLVLNVKRPLLERIARCTGAQIVPSIDHMNPQKLGTCETFHVDKYFEEHGSAGQGGKKLTKTLMFFEGCPRPLGCTILLKGANGDELKKVKHVVQYGFFAAYHLALETSFLADEGASLPELPLKSPITVTLPDKPSSVERSISTVPGFSVVDAREHQGTEPIKELLKSNDDQKKERNSSCCVDSMDESLVGSLTHMQAPSRDVIPSGQDTLSFHNKNFLPNNDSKEEDKKSRKEFFQCTRDVQRESMLNNDLISDSFYSLEPSRQTGDTVLPTNHQEYLEPHHVKRDYNNIQDEILNSKEDFPPSTSDHQSILVSLSTRCVWKGTVCDRSHLVRIKYYGSSDKPLGRFLRDQLFDQSYRCHSCEMPSEAHVHCYTHRQGSLTISVRKLPKVLPGERKGKIWMWHRCLKCPRVNGFPPATRRIVMSNAAWGLSFGKFLELSFSNHAAASRVASCGHSLHRNCLRFYGFGEMVACFRYASIDLHSAHLPPPKLEFNYDNQDWLQKEEDEVHNRANMLFAEVGKALKQMSDKFAGVVLQEGGSKASDFRNLISELEGMMQKEKEEFGELLQKVAKNGEVKFGHPVVDILELNKLRRQIMIHSYVWDQRLVYASNQSKIILKEESRNSLPNVKEKPMGSGEKVVEVNVTSRPGRGQGSCDSFLLEANPDGSLTQGCTDLSQPGEVHKCEDEDISTSQGKVDLSLSDGANIGDQHESLEFVGAVQGAQSEGEPPIMANLSDTLDAAWIGESHPTNLTPKENNYVSPDSSVKDPLPMGDLVAAKFDFESYAGNIGRDETGSKHHSKLHLRGLDTRWRGMPFPNLFSSFNKTSSLNTQKLGEYNPVYILSFRELERQTGARLLLPAGINDVIVPVYDDEPTSAIAYVLMSLDYHVQMAESERAKDSGDCSVSLPLFDSTSLLSLSSFDETITNTYRSFGSSDEGMSLSSVSRSSQAGDPHLDTKDLHARVSFTDDGSLGKVKYTVTCYFAKRFEALRRICCPAELDFVRSLSRCKKWGAQGGKSNVFFAKTLDDRFIIKQVTKTELESFIKFAPAYFKYLSESISSGSPSCLAKILGIYQVTSKHLKGGKETKMDVLVMENLLFRRNIRLLYDLKGSSRSRYNPDTSGSNKVLLDQNLIEAMPTSPIFVGNKAKRLLERAVWNDTSFLASIYVMDYSLLVGVDEEKHELVLGIIDFMRQYTWDKHLETWVKTSGILGGPKNTAPTVISPQQYKKRFRKAMSAYFLMVPDQWSPSMLHPDGSQFDLCDEHS